MQFKMRVLTILAAAFLMVQGAALAEVVQGQVTAVNQGDRSLTVQRMAEEAGGQGKEISLKVPESAELRGIQTFDEVGVGDEIRAEANKPALGIGNWEARWIEKSDLNASDAALMQAGQQEMGTSATNPAESSAAGAPGNSSTTNY